MATTPTVLQQPDLAEAYEGVYDVLKSMYWEASTVDAKDEVHGVMEEVGDIIDQLVQEDLVKDTAAFLALQPRISAANNALKKIAADVMKITKNLRTAAAAASAVAKVIALMPKV